MYVFIHMCMSVCLCMCVDLDMCLYMFMYVDLCVCVFVCVLVCGKCCNIFIYAVCMCVCVCLCMHVCVCNETVSRLCQVQRSIIKVSELNKHVRLWLFYWGFLFYDPLMAHRSVRLMGTENLQLQWGFIFTHLLFSF